ncbi:hypothetical protein IG631_01890 [Alternaria alternata]|nr:hypothetical protein IG631_01890 [Alternaria alternata]
MPRLAPGASFQPHGIACFFFSRLATAPAPAPRGRRPAATTWAEAEAGCRGRWSLHIANGCKGRSVRHALTLAYIANLTQLNHHHQARTVPGSNAAVTGDSLQPQAHQVARLQSCYTCNCHQQRDRRPPGAFVTKAPHSTYTHPVRSLCPATTRVTRARNKTHQIAHP